MSEQDKSQNNEQLIQRIGELEELNEALRTSNDILKENIEVLKSNNKTLTLSNKILKNDNEELRKLNEEITKHNEILENQYGETNERNGESGNNKGESNGHNGEYNNNNGDITETTKHVNQQNQVVSKKTDDELLAEQRQQSVDRFEDFFTLDVLRKAGFKEIPMKKRDELKAIFLFIAEHPNVQHQVVQRELRIAKNTLSKRIRVLKDFRFIRRNGSKKFGGYVLTEEGMKVVKRNVS